MRQVRAWAWACSFPLSCTIARMNGYSMSDSAFCILDTGKRSLGWDGMIGCFFRCRCLYTVWRFRCAHACYGIGVGVNHTSFIPPHTLLIIKLPEFRYMLCSAAGPRAYIHPSTQSLPRFCLALPCLALSCHPCSSARLSCSRTGSLLCISYITSFSI